MWFIAKKKKQSILTEPEVIQMLDWADNSFKSVIINMFKESNKNMCKIGEEKYDLMREEIENLNREMKILKNITKSKF